MKFIGRNNEIDLINSIVNSDNFVGCVVYGRRRLGKTELLKHCLTNSPHDLIFYQCTKDNERNNIDALTQLIKDKFNVDNIYFESFSDCVEYVFKLGLERQINFVIDEIPYILRMIQGFDSQLQRIIDKYNKITRIKFFICGSSISMMKNILVNSSPLYNRFNKVISLKEMDYYDASLFYPSFSNEDKVKLYAAFGGTPFYLQQIDESLSVKQNIINLITGSFSTVFDDITYSLKEELTKLNNAYTVFVSIAKGSFHYSDILQKSSLPNSSALYDVLDVLQEMDLIEYIYPINDKNNKKKSGYKIRDNLLLFYYKYVFSNLSRKSLMNDDDFYDSFIKEDFESTLVPQIFEKIAKEFLIRKNKSKELPNLLLDIGTYWYDSPITKQNGQFDLVGLTKKGYIFYEVKYTNKKVDESIINKEIEQVNNTSLQVYNYGFISKSGFSLKKNHSYELYTLDDIFNL